MQVHIKMLLHFCYTYFNVPLICRCEWLNKNYYASELRSNVF